MTVTPDLTLTEIADECADTVMATYVAAMSALPGTIGMAEFLHKFLTAAFIAQTKKNTAAAEAATDGVLAVGEALAAYSAPVFTAPVLNTEDGTMVFGTTLSISTASTTDGNLSYPLRA